MLRYSYKWLLLLFLSSHVLAAEMRFSSIMFSEDGAPASITCRFRIDSNKQIEPAMVLIEPDHINYKPTKLKLVSRTKNYYELEASIDLKEWDDRIYKDYALRKWKLSTIEGRTLKIPDDKGFIRVLEVGDHVLIGFSLGRADLDPEVKAFLKQQDK